MIHNRAIKKPCGFRKEMLRALSTDQKLASWNPIFCQITCVVVSPLEDTRAVFVNQLLIVRPQCRYIRQGLALAVQVALLKADQPLAQ